MRNKRDLQQRLHLCRGMDACTFSSLELSAGDTRQEPTQTSLVSAIPLFLAKILMWGKKENTHLKEQSQLGSDPPGFCSSNLGSDPTSQRAVMATEQSSLTPNISSSTSVSSSIPYQGESCQHTLRKEVNCTHVKSSFSFKGFRDTKPI